MRISNLDKNHDWTFGKGEGDFLTRKEAVGLNVKTRILSWVGDCFFDMDAGIDWVNRLGSKNQRNLLELDLRRIILQSEGVTGIVSFDTILNGRDFFATYEITTIYGIISGETPNLIPYTPPAIEINYVFDYLDRVFENNFRVIDNRDM